MRHWEYRTLSVHQVSVSFTKTKGWRLKEINEQEQPDWKKARYGVDITDEYEKPIPSILRIIAEKWGM